MYGFVDFKDDASILINKNVTFDGRSYSMLSLILIFIAWTHAIECKGKF